jgi:hypothetical protein
MSHSVLYRVMNSPMSPCASARFWKRWRYRHCYLRVRMTRFTIPLPLTGSENSFELRVRYTVEDLEKHGGGR